MGRASAIGLAMLLGSCHAVSGFNDIRFEDKGPATVEQISSTRVDRIDLLLVIDNSRSMADKQRVLELAVPDLVGVLINPRCLDQSGQPASKQPDNAFEPCPEDTVRAFQPVTDVHIGIITSSIGGHGADACAGDVIPSENDGARLITRTSTEGTGSPVTTYQDLGFLAWDPLGALNPPGVPLKEQDTLIDNIRKMVVGAGEIGCGFEAPLEAWYRFLVEPDPYESIELEQNTAVQKGTDDVLLAQRAAFLRPDSLLAIVMLSDENDCSMIDGGQYYFAAQIYSPGTNQPYHLPKPRAACATDPDSPCCLSCGQTAGDDCSEEFDDCGENLEPLADSINLRCFDQKRRFGIDFLQPIDRYVTGLTSDVVSDRHGNLVANPIFDSQSASDRNPALVFLAGIVGVPWQDVARKDGGGKPDLLVGLDESGRPAGGFQNSYEMAKSNVWEMLIGDPSKKLPPTDPLMIESVDPRSGTNPVTGSALQPPSAAVLANPINGHEYSVPQRNDLQYACIFPLDLPRDCTDIDQTACDCSEAGNDNPLCQDPNSGKAGQTQFFAKAYPGTRQLRVLKEIGPQGIVGSICPEQQSDPALFNYGYRPSIGGVLDTLEQSLSTRFCLSQTVSAGSDKRLGCRLIEARHTEVGSCNCNTPARKALTDADLALLAEIKSDPLHTSEQWNCFCEMIQTSGNDLQNCQEDVAEPVINDFGYLVNGWCYVDGSSNPEVGNPELLHSCLGGEQRVIRFVGDGPLTGGRLFLSCD